MRLPTTTLPGCRYEKEAVGLEDLLGRREQAYLGLLGIAGEGGRSELVLSSGGSSAPTAAAGAAGSNGAGAEAGGTGRRSAGGLAGLGRLFSKKG